MLTETERAVVTLLRADPLISTGELAERLGTSRDAVRVHLSNLGKKGVILGRGYVLRRSGAAVVIGGANLDIKAQSAAAAVAATSNPGSVTSSVGGVGRNIAENLARLGTTTHLVAAIGDDPFGERVLSATRAAGVHLDHVHRSTAPTGTYTAVLDHDGELVIAVSAMRATEELDAAKILSHRDLVTHADHLVLDGNLRAEAIVAALDVAATADVPVLLEPVSDAKAARLAEVLDPDRPIAVLTPNRSELAAMTQRPTRTDRQLRAAAADLHERGVSLVWARLGERGSLVSRADGDVTEHAALPGEVVDVTGAGDSMAGAYVHARLAGRDVDDAVAFAGAAAALTVEHTAAVRPDLTDASVEARLASALDDSTRTT
ncbi:MAG: carbohydrate kinase [Actinomycetota bacterium]